MKILDFGNGNGVLVSDEEYNTYIRCKGCGKAGRIAVIRHLYGMQCPTCKGADFDLMTRQQVDAAFRETMKNGYRRMSEKDWDGKVCEVCGEPAIIRVMPAHKGVAQADRFFCREHQTEFYEEMKREEYDK